MSDITYNKYQHYGTNAQRLAFVPIPPPGVQPIYIWYETDTNNVYVYTTAWHGPINGSGGGGGITQLTGDVTAGPGSGSQASTLAASGVAAASYGDATHVPAITVDTKGRITAASNVTISGGSGGAKISTSPYASPPVSPSSGDLWLPSDSFYEFRYSGSAWVPWGPSFPFIDPNLQTWAWVNQGTATISTTNGAIHLVGTQQAGENIRLRKKTAPATPYTITIAFMPFMTTANYQSVGVMLRESATSKLVGWAINHTNSFIIYRWNTEVSFSGSPYTTASMVQGSPLFLQVVNDGTNLKYNLSPDGQNWFQAYTEVKSAFFTTGPDEVGFFANGNVATTFAPRITLLSWKES